MKDKRERENRQRWRGRLSVQLTVSVLVVNLIVLIFCFLFLYMKVNDILLEKDKNDMIERFEQAEYNINSLAEQVDRSSRRLSSDYNLKRLFYDGNLSEKDRVYLAKQALTSMEEMQYNYPYLELICYYSTDGVILKSEKELCNGNFFIHDMEKTDPYYSTELYQVSGGLDQKLQWFGMYSNDDFGIIPHDDTKSRNYISAVRNNIFNTGSLIINIDMNYILDIFQVKNSGMTENVYIIDQEDHVVVAKENDMLGKKMVFTQGEQLREGIYKYREQGRDGENQIIVYELPALGFCLVSETPVEEVTKESTYLRNILLLFCMLSIVISVTISAWWVSRILKPLKQMDEGMKRLSEGELGSVLENVPQNEVGQIVARFNQMSVELENLFRKNQEMEREKRELEMKTLRAQINPHLIYNVLNHLKWRALFSNERSIAESVSLLADFLSPVFKNQKLMCSLREEVNYVKSYIAVMNLLRTGKFTLVCDIPEEYYEYQIVRFLLQPVVENAIQHGYSKQNGGKISISMHTDGTDGVILIEDDGNGMEQAKLMELSDRLNQNLPQEVQGIGLVNVNRRIKIQYGENYGISIRNGKEKGLLVSLRIRLSL